MSETEHMGEVACPKPQGLDRQIIDAMDLGYSKGRNDAIEECARVAQQWLIRAEQGSGEDLLDAIQALKERGWCAYCGTLKPYHSADCPRRPYASDRDAIIEECARVAETNAFSMTVVSGAVGTTIAAAIRALKDQTNKGTGT